MNERIEFIARNDRLTRQVTVIVPVYLANEEGIRVFRLLLDSLSLSYSQVNPLLNFIFLDDCSPLQDVEMYLREYNMLERVITSYSIHYTKLYERNEKKIETCKNYDKKPEKLVLSGNKHAMHGKKA